MARPVPTSGVETKTLVDNALRIDALAETIAMDPIIPSKCEKTSQGA
jgi:hypothetical protein